MNDLKIGDIFWEYNSMHGTAYPRKAHSKSHVKYFRKGYMTRAFFTKEELLSVYPNALI